MVSDDRVPETLMQAFERNPDGTFRVRRIYGSDGIALLVAVLLPAAVVLVVWLTWLIVSAIWGTPGGEAAGAGVIA